MTPSKTSNSCHLSLPASCRSSLPRFGELSDHSSPNKHDTYAAAKLKNIFRNSIFLVATKSHSFKTKTRYTHSTWPPPRCILYLERAARHVTKLSRDRAVDWEFHRVSRSDLGLGAVPRAVERRLKQNCGRRRARGRARERVLERGAKRFSGMS